jgi:outer membrane receptor protein involved in Fe transport
MESEVDQFTFSDDGTPTPIRAPVSRIIPVMSNWGVRYRPIGSIWWLEIHGSAYSDAERLALKDITDTTRIPPGGTLGFAVVGIRGAARLFDQRLRLAGGIENLGDEDYRIRSSEKNMPGRNLTLSASYRW